MSLFDFLRKWSGRLEQEEAAEPALQPESAATGVDATATKVPHSKTQNHPDPEARAAAILAHLALAAENPAAQATRNWKLSRVVWRAGELCLPEALPYLAQLLQQPGSENLMVPGKPSTSGRNWPKPIAVWLSPTKPANGSFAAACRPYYNLLNIPTILL